MHSDDHISGLVDQVDVADDPSRVVRRESGMSVQPALRGLSVLEAIDPHGQEESPFCPRGRRRLQQGTEESLKARVEDGGMERVAVFASPCGEPQSGQGLIFTHPDPFDPLEARPVLQADPSKSPIARLG